MCHLHLLSVYYANCFKVKEPNAPLHFRSIPCIDIVSAAEWKVVLQGRVDVKCSRGLGEPQRPMLDAQAGRAWPSPAPPPCAFSLRLLPGQVQRTLQHPFGAGHIRQESGSPGGHEFSLSLPPWLPARSETALQLLGLPSSHGEGARPSATEAPRASRGPETCPVLHLAPSVSGPWACPG